MQALKPTRTPNSLRSVLCSRIRPNGPRLSHMRVTQSSRAPMSTASLLPLRPTTTLPVASRGEGCSSQRALQQTRHASSAASPETLRKTALYDLHLAHGAKMVPFGGFHMPVQYTGLSVSQSHVFTREHASLFDVGHMVQRIFQGPGATAFLQRVTPSDLEGLGKHRSTLSCLMHADGSGGIVDDTVITKLSDGSFYVVTNAACREKDDAYFKEQLQKWHQEAGHEGLHVEHGELDSNGLIALQGPEAEQVLSKVIADLRLDLKKLFFGQSVFTELKLSGRNSGPVLVSRGGYTGEDGFEISIPEEDTVAATEALLAAGGPEKVQFAGLGARDSLRLEAGMCLYGHDLDDTTTPVEAGLSWIIPKERRTPDAGYYGAEVLAKQLIPKSKGGAGMQLRRVGFIVEGAPAREGAEIVSRPASGEEATKLGSITSGCPSPTLGKNIAMGYIKDGFHKAGTEVDVVVRGRNRKAVVTKMPFFPTKYWKGTAPA